MSNTPPVSLGNRRHGSSDPRTRIDLRRLIGKAKSHFDSNSQLDQLREDARKRSFCSGIRDLWRPKTL